MKRIGVITDVHGNLLALNAILALLDSMPCDEILYLGDVVDIGPNSLECLNVLLSRSDVTMLLGNHDQDCALNNDEAKHLSHVPQAHKKQVFGTIPSKLKQKLRNLPLYVTRKCGGKQLLFLHYALTAPNVSVEDMPIFCQIDMNPTAQTFDKMFVGWQCDAVFFGHKHEPCNLQGNRIYVDVGSVGCHPKPIARGVVVEYDDVHWHYKRVGAPYDMQATQKLLEQMPCGKQLFDFYYLRKKPN